MLVLVGGYWQAFMGYGLRVLELMTAKGGLFYLVKLEKLKDVWLRSWL